MSHASAVTPIVVAGPFGVVNNKKINELLLTVSCLISKMCGVQLSLGQHPTGVGVYYRGHI